MKEECFLIKKEIGVFEFFYYRSEEFLKPQTTRILFDGKEIYNRETYKKGANNTDIQYCHYFKNGCDEPVIQIRYCIVEELEKILNRNFKDKIINIIIDNKITDVLKDIENEWHEAKRKENHLEFLMKYKKEIEEAKRTGKNIKVACCSAPCNDPKEECDIDIITNYITPEGKFLEIREHTW